MDTTEARDIAEVFQERARHLGDGIEGVNLRKAARTICDMANQIDAQSEPTMDDSVEPAVNDKKPRKREKLLSE